MDEDLPRRSVSAALLAVTATVTAAAAGGCALQLQPSPVPMEVIRDSRGCRDTLAPVLLVMLPGIYMEPVEMQREGFVEALRQRGRAVDVLIVDSRIDYVRDDSILRRLRNEVMQPARAQGYQQIWLAGISLGGFLAMIYAMAYPGEVAGLVALAPYLGPPELVTEIAAAGGAAGWQRSGHRLGPDALERQVWDWLAEPPASAPPIWLGYGNDDRFVAAHRLLRERLPTGHSDSVPGGHDWAPWRSLWSRWLDRDLLPAAGVCRTGLPARA